MSEEQFQKREENVPQGGVNIFQQDTKEEKGEEARNRLFVGVLAVTDLLKTTLGPKGQDKILQPSSDGARFNELQVTNDGATILKSIHVSNPAAKILVDISKTQDDEVGDGTTSVCVLTGELLREAEKLMFQKIHPQTIIEGWRMAVDVAREALVKSSTDNSSDKEKFKQDLLQIARTTLGSKILGQNTTHMDHFAKLAVDAVMRLKGSTDLQMIHIIKKIGGSLEDSFLDEGFILEKKIGVGQPKRIENAKILLANTAMDNDKVKIYSAKVQVDSPAELAKIEKAERDRMLAKCEKIVNHQINCFINRQLIYNLPEQYFADHGVMAIEHADFEGIERLAFVTGGEIVSTFDNPERVKLGHCKLIEEIMIGEDKVIKFSGVERGEACTIVLRGATKHILDEAERSLHDALCVLTQTTKETRTVYGGGCAESIMAQAVEELAKKTPGKKLIAIEAFARALRMIPTILADNAGYDSSELISQLKAAHYEGKVHAGLNMETGEIGDMASMGIKESLKVKMQILMSAAEAAEMILRIDDIINAPARQRRHDPRYPH